LAGRKLGEFSESSMIHQTKTIQISTYNYNLLVESIHSPNFFAKYSKQINLPNFLPTKLQKHTMSMIDASRPAVGMVPGSARYIKRTNRSMCNFSSSIGRLFHSLTPAEYTNLSQPLNLASSWILAGTGDTEVRTRR